MSQPEVYRGLLAVLHRYLSPASVSAALGVALERRGLSPATVGPEELPQVVAEAMVGLRMFCAPERIGYLMLDLADYCEDIGGAAEP